MCGPPSFRSWRPLTSRAALGPGLDGDEATEWSIVGGGPSHAVFFSGGGVAYTCAGNLISRIADAKGDRLLEPNGTVVTALAVTTKGDRLYYTAGDAAKGIGV